MKLDTLWLGTALTWKRQPELFKFDSRRHRCKAKPPGIWRLFGGETDHNRQKSRFRERKVARKLGMSPQTTLLKCMRSSWQFPFKTEIYVNISISCHIWSLDRGIGLRILLTCEILLQSRWLWSVIQNLGRHQMKLSYRTHAWGQPTEA